MSTMLSTTLSSAAGVSDQLIYLASYTGVIPPGPPTFTQTLLYCEREAMLVISGGVDPAAKVVRGSFGTVATAHPEDATVWVGPTIAYGTSDPSGTFSLPQGGYVPLVVIPTGGVWADDGGVWAQINGGGGGGGGVTGYYSAENELPGNIGPGDDAPPQMDPGLWQKLEDGGDVTTLYFLAEREGVLHELANDGGIELPPIPFSAITPDPSVETLEMGGGGVFRPQGDYTGEVHANIWQFSRGSLAHTTIDTAISPYDIVENQYYVYFIDTTDGNVTINLSDVPASGAAYYFKRISAGANTATVDGNGNDIDGSGTLDIPTQYDSYGIIWSGTEWFIFSGHEAA